MSIESGKFEMWPGQDPESEAANARSELSGERQGEVSEVDLRHESEVFADHERLSNAEDEAWLALARDTLAEHTDGVLHIDIEDYRYDTSTNPFAGSGPRVTRIYQIARIIDVVLLHRFMYHDILVVGLRSMDFANTYSRASFAKRLNESGGGIVVADDEVGYDFEAMRFVPYTASFSVGSWLERFHRQSPRRDARPHYPVDVWLIYDESAYDRVGDDDMNGRYRLKPGYDRKNSLLVVAQIN